MRRLELSDEIFGRLSVQNRVDDSVVWRCLCTCGQIVNIKSIDLSRGRKKSCGCLQLESRRRNFNKRRVLKYPKAPEPYPIEAALLFKKYQYLVEVLLTQKGSINGLEETATDLLMRACWIVIFRSSTEDPINETGIKSYLCGWLFKDRAVLKNIRNHARIIETEKIKEGDTMTYSTLNHSTMIDSAEISLSTCKIRTRLKFDRK